MLNGPQQMFIYFSQLLELPVFDKNDRQAGRIYDIIVKPTIVYPQSYCLIIRKGFPNRKYATVPWSDVAGIYKNEVRIGIDASGLTFSEKHDNKEELTLRRDILDQQVVDTSNHKVIRVNDIHLLIVENSLMVAHVDISLKGLVRRLGFEGPVDFIVGLFRKNAAYLKKEHLISWKYIQPLSINPVSMTIKVNVPHKQLLAIPAADLGEIFLDLDLKRQIALFKSLDLTTRAKIFMNVDFKTQKSWLEELDIKEAADIINNIPSDEATDFLERLPRNKTEELLNLLESKNARKLSQLLGYSSDSAGGLMTAEYISFTQDVIIEEALRQIKERVFKIEPVQFVYIVDESHHLIGSTNLRRMLSTNPQEPLAKAMFPKTYFVHPDSSVKEVAYLMDKYKYYAIPVVDENNVMQGIITVDDILSQVISIAWRRLKKIKPKLAP